MQKKDLQKQQRRKRKDPQSRDFRCKCGKSYLSYAAVYTHVKNKHEGQKQYQQSISKPQKQKLKRGRPKDKKQIILSNQTQTLSICEQTTLQIYEQLKQKKDHFNHHIILEGNQQMNQEEYQKIYKELIDRKFVKCDLVNKNDGDAEIFQAFVKGVIKHFSAEIAAKVTYVANTLAELYQDDNILQNQQKVRPYIQNINALDMWYGQNYINETIYQAMLKWISTVTKQQNDE